MTVTLKENTAQQRSDLEKKYELHNKSNILYVLLFKYVSLYYHVCVSDTRRELTL